MDRRTALRGVACAVAPFLAGCTGTGGSPADGTATEPAGGTPNGTDDGSPSTPRVTDRSFTVTAVECALATDSPTARFRPEPPEPDATTATVEVTGSIDGNDTCHTARLADLRLSDGELTVAVGSYVPEEKEGVACSQCLVAIDYALTVTTAGTPPSAVVVVHDGERVGRVSLPD